MEHGLKLFKKTQFNPTYQGQSHETYGEKTFHDAQNFRANSLENFRLLIFKWYGFSCFIAPKKMENLLISDHTVFLFTIENLVEEYRVRNVTIPRAFQPIFFLFKITT